MTRHAKPPDPLQIVDRPKATTVEIPLPPRATVVDIESSIPDSCVDAGQQVWGAMMEQDREENCGPRCKRGPE